MKVLYEIKVAQQKADVNMDVSIAQVNFATGLLVARVDKLEADKEFANWANDELLKQTRELIELSKHLRVQNRLLCVRVLGVGVAKQMDSSPGPASRRKRPRSGSLPPILSWDHHEMGNGETETIADIYGLTIVAFASEAGSLWSHIAAALFSTRRP